MKYIDAEKLKAEIERRKKELLGQAAKLGTFESDRVGIYDDIELYDDLLAFISSLQQEPRFLQYDNWEFREAEMLVALAKEELLKPLQQEQPEVDLENTAHLIAIETLNDTKFMTTTMGYVLGKLQDIFIAGAKWGAEHLKK